MPIAALLGACLFFVLFIAPLRDPHPPAKFVGGTLAVRHAKIYVSADAQPIENGTLLVRDGRIVGLGSDLAVPSESRLLPCENCTIVAGFWNAHVHFTQPKWNWAAYKPVATLNAELADMLTSRGFTTVVDLGSDLRVTVSLRRRIEAGELSGPAIFTAGSGLYPPHGIPYYVKRTLPWFIQLLLPQPESPSEAVKDVEGNIQNGADVLKLFTGSYVEKGRVLTMPVAIGRAAVTVAHQHGQVAFSHPSNLAGTLAARDSGVDVLAHAPDDTAGVDRLVIQDLVDRKIAMIPTLKMFATTVTKKPAYLLPIYDEVRQFRHLGGTLLFGTDVGYMDDYSTEDEFAALAKCGLSWRDMLDMLTVAPARRMGVEQEKGSLAIGKAADFVMLAGDPSEDLQAFSRVLCTVRGGRVLYAKNHQSQRN